MDKIIGRGLRFFGCHGVLEEEKVTPQPFEVDFELHLDLSAAGQRDDLSLTVSYAEVFHTVQKIVEEEALPAYRSSGRTVSPRTIKKFPVQEVKITVYKPQAPVEGNFRYSR